MKEKQTSSIKVIGLAGERAPANVGTPPKESIVQQIAQYNAANDPDIASFVMGTTNVSLVDCRPGERLRAHQSHRDRRGDAGGA